MHVVFSSFCSRWSFGGLLNPMLSTECQSSDCLVINIELLVCRARGLDLMTVYRICDDKLLEFHLAVCAFGV